MKEFTNKALYVRAKNLTKSEFYRIVLGLPENFSADEERPVFDENTDVEAYVDAIIERQKQRKQQKYDYLALLEDAASAA